MYNETIESKPTKDRLMLIFSLVLVAASVFFIGLSVLRGSERASPVDNTAGLVPNSYVDLQQLAGRAIPIEDQTQIVALFLLSDNACEACLSEVHEFVKEILERVTIGYRYETVALISASDSISAFRFIAIADLPMEAYYLRDDEFGRKVLTNDMLDIEDNIAFIDEGNREVFFVKQLPSALTTPAYKRQLLSDVESSWYLFTGITVNDEFRPSEH